MFWDTIKGQELANILMTCLPEIVDKKMPKAQKQFHYIKNSETTSSDIIGWVLVKTGGEVRFVNQIDNMLIFEADRDVEINTLIDSINKRFNSEGR